MDRRGIVLAENVSAYTLEIAPNHVEDLEATIEALSRIVEISPRDKRRFRRLRGRRTNRLRDRCLSAFLFHPDSVLSHQ